MGTLPVSGYDAIVGGNNSMFILMGRAGRFVSMAVWLMAFFAIPLAAFATADWTMFQKDPIGHGAQEGTGIVASTTTEFTNNLYGGNHQPLVADLDNDNENELVVFSGNYLRILDRYAKLKGEKVVGALQSQPSLAQYDGKPHKEIVGIVNRNGQNYYTVWRYTGGVNGFTTVQEAFVATSTIGAVKCVEFDGEQGGEECVFKGSDGTVSIYNRAGLLRNFDVSAGSGPDGNVFVPAFYDVNGDRRVDGAFMHNNILTLLDINGTTTTKDLTSDGFQFPYAGRWDVTFTTSRPSIILAAAFPLLSCEIFFERCKSYLLSYLPNGEQQWAHAYQYTVSCVPPCSGRYGAPPLTYPRVIKLPLPQGETVSVAGVYNGDSFRGTALFRYNANGTLIQQINIPETRWEFDTVSFADFTNDGDPEFITRQGIYAPNGTQVMPLALAGSPIAADVDRDGMLDIVMTTPGNTKIIYFRVVAPPPGPPAVPQEPNNAWLNLQRDGRGSALQPGSAWFSQTSVSRIATSTGSSFQPLVADLDANGDQEIVIVNGGTLLVYDRGMRLKASLPLGFIGSQFAIVQYDRDPQLEIVGVVAGAQWFYGALEFDGQNLLFQQIVPVSTNGGIPSHVRCTDFDGDQDMDCAFKDSLGAAYFYDAAGHSRMFDVSGGTGNDTKPFVPAFDDIDRDGIMETFFVHNGRMTAVDRNGIKWQSDVSPFLYATSFVEVTTADLDGGHKEIVATFHNTGTVWLGNNASHLAVFQSDGTPLWSKPLQYRMENSGSIQTISSPINSPLVTDVDRDGFDEIGIMSVTGTRWSGGYDYTDVSIAYYEYDGAWRWSVSFGNLWHNNNDQMLSGSTFADMNGDGHLDWITAQRIVSPLDGRTIYEFGDTVRPYAPVPVHLGFGCLSLLYSKPGESGIYLLPACVLE